MGWLTDMLTAMPQFVQWLAKIKAQGHGLYYLSNYHHLLRNYIMETYDFFALFDGGVFSCDVKLLKPQPQIYQRLLEKYHTNLN